MDDLAAYDFELPPSAIAQEPGPERDSSRALFLDRQADRSVDGLFTDLVERLTGDEVLVFNDTRVIRARVRTQRSTGGQVECFLLRPEADGVWQCWLSPSRRIKPGEVLSAGDHTLRVIERQGSFWRLEVGEPEIIERIGEVPLPPYIQRQVADSRLNSLDAERYQTIFARGPGAVAAPTAGLHFSPELVSAIGDRGVELCPVTLHVGPGTFEPIRATRLADHRVSPELFEISANTLRTLAAARAAGRPIIAVGTTTVRVLESLETLSRGDDLQGETSLTILPGHEFRHVDGLITNFHLPRSSLLVLVSAFLGRERTLAAYQQAILWGFRFYSYGDAMIILPQHASREC